MHSALRPERPQQTSPMATPCVSDALALGSDRATPCVSDALALGSDRATPWVSDALALGSDRATPSVQPLVDAFLHTAAFGSVPDQIGFVFDSVKSPIDAQFRSNLNNLLILCLEHVFSKLASFGAFRGALSCQIPANGSSFTSAIHSSRRRTHCSYQDDLQKDQPSYKKPERIRPARSTKIRFCQS
jgi:hypothetical protein